MMAEKIVTTFEFLTRNRWMMKFRFLLISCVFFIGIGVCLAQTAADLYQTYPLKTSYEGALAVLPLFERQCIERFGEGAKFEGHPIFSHREFNEELQSYVDLYDVAISCDGCKGEVYLTKKEKVRDECYKKCLKPYHPQCNSRGWGAYDNGSLKCSQEKDYSLPGCSESLSSESVGVSSSSEKTESSSSEDENSSSSDGEECGSGTGHCPVSSSGSGKINSSSGAHGSGIGEEGTQCYIGDEESCRPWSDEILFKRRPVVLGEIRLYGQKPYCQEDGNIVFRAGIPIAYFRAASWLCLKDDCMSNHSIEGFWECNEGSVLNNGCAAEPEHRSIPFYYSVMTRKLRTSWVTVDFSSTPESGMNLAYFDVNELLSIVAREGVFVDGDDGFSYDLTDLYPQFSKNSFDDYVRACAYHLNVDVSSSSESLQSSSSVVAKSSSSSYTSSSSEESSSSIETSSSSYECSSSDCGDDISSSSQEEFSSSSDELVSSSSVYVEESSSSLQIESSSSEFVYSSSSDGHFVSGGDQVHSPDQIFNDGLDNMEPGSCYSLNPDRGTQYGWMNTDAQDSWWWREVDCESGEKVDRNRVGVCPGFPLDKVPSNPKRTCVAYDGRCYRCKSENSYVDCSQEWLWKWSFNVQNIGTWYAEVDCYNPFEDDDNDSQCLEGNVLMKMATDFSNAGKINYNDFPTDYLNVAKSFDALGRRLTGTRPKFLKTFKKQVNKIEPLQNTAFDEGRFIFIPIEDLGFSRNYLAKEGDVCHDYSCGNLGTDYGVGGDVGVYCGYPCTKINTENGKVKIKIVKKEETGLCSENDPKYTITFSLSATVTIKRKNVYYVAPVGYDMGDDVVSEKSHEAAKRHEIGHKKSFECLEKNKMFKSEHRFTIENICETEFKCNKKGVLKKIAERVLSIFEEKQDYVVKYNDNLWLKMCGWYHKNFSREDGPGGPKNPQSVDCPTTETLLNNDYDLTGCEVIK